VLSPRPLYQQQKQQQQQTPLPPPQPLPLAPAQLTSAASRARSWRELRALRLEHARRLAPIHVCAMLVRLAHLSRETAGEEALAAAAASAAAAAGAWPLPHDDQQQQHRALCSVLLSDALRALPMLEPRQVANVMWAAAVLSSASLPSSSPPSPPSLVPRRWRLTFARRAAEMAASGAMSDPQHLASVLSAHARFAAAGGSGARAGAGGASLLLRPVLAAAADPRALSRARPQELASLAHSAATLRRLWRDERALVAVDEEEQQHEEGSAATPVSRRRRSRPTVSDAWLDALFTAIGGRLETSSSSHFGAAEMGACGAAVAALAAGPSSAAASHPPPPPPYLPPPIFLDAYTLALAQALEEHQQQDGSTTALLNSQALANGFGALGAVARASSSAADDDDDDTGRRSRPPRRRRQAPRPALVARLAKAAAASGADDVIDGLTPSGLATTAWSAGRLLALLEGSGGEDDADATTTTTTTARPALRRFIRRLAAGSRARRAFPQLESARELAMLLWAAALAAPSWSPSPAAAAAASDDDAAARTPSPPPARPWAADALRAALRLAPSASLADLAQICAALVRLRVQPGRTWARAVLGRAADLLRGGATAASSSPSSLARLLCASARLGFAPATPATFADAALDSTRRWMLADGSGDRPSPPAALAASLRGLASLGVRPPPGWMRLFWRSVVRAEASEAGGLSASASAHVLYALATTLDHQAPGNGAAATAAAPEAELLRALAARVRAARAAPENGGGAGAGALGRAQVLETAWALARLGYWQRSDAEWARALLLSRGGQGAAVAAERPMRRATPPARGAPLATFAASAVQPASSGSRTVVDVSEVILDGFARWAEATSASSAEAAVPAGGEAALPQPAAVEGAAAAAAPAVR
jgi:hypothetical protein